MIVVNRDQSSIWSWSIAAMTFFISEYHEEALKWPSIATYVVSSINKRPWQNIEVAACVVVMKRSRTPEKTPRSVNRRGDSKTSSANLKGEPPLHKIYCNTPPLTNFKTWSGATPWTLRRHARPPGYDYQSHSTHWRRTLLRQRHTDLPRSSGRCEQRWSSIHSIPSLNAPYPVFLQFANFTPM